MPTYEYTCKDCGEHLEVVQSFKDHALSECPACGGHLRKVFGNIGIAFKGSGFYKTDSRSDSRKAGKGVETKAAEGGTATSAGKASETSSGAKADGTKDGGGSDSGPKTGAKDSGSGSTKSPVPTAAAS